MLNPNLPPLLKQKSKHQSTWIKIHTVLQKNFNHRVNESKPNHLLYAKAPLPYYMLIYSLQK